MKSFETGDDQIAKLASRADCSGAVLSTQNRMRGPLWRYAPALHLLSAPANASPNWRGLVGCLKPTPDNSSLVEKTRLLPTSALSSALNRGFAQFIKAQLGGEGSGRRISSRNRSFQESGQMLTAVSGPKLRLPRCSKSTAIQGSAHMPAATLIPMRLIRFMLRPRVA